MKVTTKSFLAYTFLPRIIPMVRDLFKPGFGLISLSIAQIYGGCGLLPRNHPYLNRANMGRYGIGQLILEAARNLKFTRNNIDQVVIFTMILGGMLLLFSQVFIFGFVIFTQAAHAMPTSYSGFFVTPNPDQDIAFILLDRVFGIPDMFNSCVAQHNLCLTTQGNPEDWPVPYHGALHDMLSFYSVGLCVVAMIIFLYYAVTVMLETAESGTPFGRRFNHVWAPVRMVVALGLLIPINFGLNGAQLLTLHVAKWGSSFATNGWIYFTNTLETANLSNMLADPEQLTGSVQKTDGANLFQFYTILSTCVRMYGRDNIDIDAYLVKSEGTPTSMLLDSATWADAVDFYDNGDIIVVFGEQDATKYRTEKGNVKPYCGELVLPASDATDPGAVAIEEFYYQRFLLDYWGNASENNPADVGGAVNPLPDPNNREQDFFYHAGTRIIEASFGNIMEADEVTYMPVWQDETAMRPNQEAANSLITQYAADLGDYIFQAIETQRAADWNQNLQRFGWAGAGIWYNKLAEKNGGMFTAVASLPTVREMPLVMKAVAEAAGAVNQARGDNDKYTPYSSGDKAISLPADLGNSANEYAQVFDAAYRVWGSLAPKETDNAGNSAPPSITQNWFTDFLQALFGTAGLYSMVDPENADIHPLAQITIMGKYLFDTSLRNIGGGTAASTIAGLGLGAVPDAILPVVGAFFRQIGMMTLSVGFVLYYVVPFMPFLYFFFQVGGWVKGMFEAMVGLPLWALAHIRIDGEGLAGQTAMPGYFMILELFLRPILTIFGLVGGIAIFAAQVKVLNEIFTLVVTNLTGFDQAAAETIAQGDAGWYGYYRGYVDQLFYTIIYAIIVYMMGTSSFKLVYMIPDKTLRWMGASVESFGDEIAHNHPEALVGKMSVGVSTATNQMGAGVGKALAAVGK